MGSHTEELQERIFDMERSLGHFSSPALESDTIVYQPVCYGPRLTKTPLYGYYHYQGFLDGEDNPANYNRKLRTNRKPGTESETTKRGAVNSYKKLDKMFQDIAQTIFHQPSRKL